MSERKINYIILGNQFSFKEYLFDNRQAFKWFSLKDDEKTREKLEEIFGDNFKNFNLDLTNENGICYECGCLTNDVVTGIRCPQCKYAFCNVHRDHVCDINPIKCKMVYSIFKLFAFPCTMEEYKSKNPNSQNTPTDRDFPIKMIGKFMQDEQKSYFTFSHDFVNHVIKHITPDLDSLMLLMNNLLKYDDLELIKSIADKNFVSEDPQVIGHNLFLRKLSDRCFDKYTSTWIRYCLIEAFSKLPIEKIDFSIMKNQSEVDKK